MLLPSLLVILLIALAVVAVSIYFGGSVMWLTFKGVAALNRVAPPPRSRAPELKLVTESPVPSQEQAPASVMQFAAVAPRRGSPVEKPSQPPTSRCGFQLCLAINSPQACYCHRCGRRLEFAAASEAA
jgi:hypothetical protein